TLCAHTVSDLTDPVSFHVSVHIPDLLSFPTRRSSDLKEADGDPAQRGPNVVPEIPRRHHGHKGAEDVAGRRKEAGVDELQLGQKLPESQDHQGPQESEEPFQAPAPLLGPPGPILQDGQSVPAPRSPAGGQSLFLRRCLLHPTTPSAPFLCGAWSWGHGGGAGSGPGPVARTLRRRASALEDVVLDVALPLALADDPHGHMGP